MLTATEVLAGSLDKTVGSLKISPPAGQTLDLSGSANLQTPAILLAGPHDFTIRNTGGGTGGLVASSAQSQHFYVQQACLAIGVPIAGNGALVKSGAGTLILEGTNAYTGPTTINEGALRAAPGSRLGSGALELRGGVLEITGGGTFNRHLDYGTPSGPGLISWSGVRGLPLPGINKEDRGSGGFAAVGASVRVDLNGLGASDIVWEDPAFVSTGYALVLGSRNANATIELVDNFSLGLSPGAYNAREFRVVDNPNATTDRARVAGVIFSDTAANRGMLNDLLKSGDGTLELTGDNTYIGGTIIAEGTLLLGHVNALGRPAAGAYVVLGNRGGTADAALLTSAPISVARDIAIPAGSSGQAVLGAAVGGPSSFTGSIGVGTTGATAAKVVNLYAEAAGTVVFSGAIRSVGGYAGLVTLNKTGAGTVVLAAANSYSGGTTVAPGTLQIGAGGATGSITGNVTNNATLAFNRTGATSVGNIAGTGTTTLTTAGTLTVTANHVRQAALDCGEPAGRIVQRQRAGGSAL